MKKSKAAGVSKLLKQGYSAREIKDRMAVSESYIYFVKKQMAAGVETVVETFTPEEVGVSEETFIEAALAASQGRGKKRVVGTMERKVPGGPATVVRATTEDTVNRVLDERATTYGSFLGLSQVAQRLKAVAHQFAGQNNKTFDADQAEALDMIFTKIGRILNGDPNYADSWTDIAGYATLVADRLQGKIR